MKKLMLSLISLVMGLSLASGQKLMVGVKAPDLKVREWLNEAPAQGTARLIEFLHSSSEHYKERLKVLDAYEKKYGDKLTIIVIAREKRDVIESAFLASPHNYSIGEDDNGKTFSNFSVQHVPFSVLIDHKGRVQWFGNPSGLDEQTISNILKTN